jgi:hypothetical protein
LPTPTADPLPTDRAPEPEAETLTPGDDLDALPADTADLRPLDPAPKLEPTPEISAAADWCDLIPVDLTDLDRLAVLYDQAAKRGEVARSRASWLLFVTAAVHARRVPNILNRPALFRKIIKSGDRHVLDDGRVVSYLTDEDEQAALAWIKTQQPAPVDRELRLVRQPDAPPAMSEDAKIIAHFLVHELAKKGYRGDPFHAFKQTDRGHDWTRPRWEAALAELEIPLEPAGPSPAMTLPELTAWGSEITQVAPPAVPMGLPPPAETPVERPTEAATHRIPRPSEPLPGDQHVSLRYADEADLRDDETLLALFAQAASGGLVPDDDEGLLRFVAAAEHALCVQGVIDRPSMFRRIVKGKWNLVTSSATDRARARLDVMQRGNRPLGGTDVLS